MKWNGYDRLFFSVSPENHGVGGGMTIEKGDIRPVINNVMKAGEELGFKVRDPNLDGPITEGTFSYFYR